MTAPQRTFSLRTYRAANAFLKPVANYALSRRLKAGKEDPGRVAERRGVASVDRPQGKLMWIHGASVGESLSVLPLIDYLAEKYPHAHFLVTTGTITSAQLMADRLPPKAIHQYVPIDQVHFVRQFLTHWHPDAVVFIESELWPVMLSELGKRDIPLALVNGRLSPKSYKSWSARKGAARELLDTFRVLLAQDTDNAERLADLAGRDVPMLGNLKQAAPALPTDTEALEQLAGDVGDRPVWLAASTHVGEEDFVVETHHQLAAQIPDILTVIAPRHPTRGDEVYTKFRDAGLSIARRSTGDRPTPETQVYLADTLGELGIFYRLSDVAFIGGSLVEVGGHNPMEPARLGSAIVTGPHVFNFRDTFQSMRQSGALALVRNERDLSASLLRLLKDPRTRNQMADNAMEWSEKSATKVLDDIVQAIGPVLNALQQDQ
ncbi:3-deoxy-D-manno-octulosonic acid transferase [Parvularcula sp. LCG005]|uniref:3-deoxy-D-manno-octulosonic acid transferase n=1 Tax=Parvularcula sp. LCG005 TaxID=3078805 RepID=UPI002942120E|nr:3-deoxy-D-manno-octulosonic acid transferase [Parvularcula sp. LCG005]WOI52059.1 3-deoxy-D-manno-octulosonic acid transferase [Parvularcula sp. LCG005]